MTQKITPPAGKVKVSLYLDRSLIEKAKKIASREERSLNYVVSKALSEQIK